MNKYSAGRGTGHVGPLLALPEVLKVQGFPQHQCHLDFLLHPKVKYRNQTKTLSP